MKIGVWKPHKYVGSVKIYYENVKIYLQKWGVNIIEFEANDILPTDVDLYWDPTCTDGKSPNKKFLTAKKPIVVTLHGAASFSIKEAAAGKNKFKYWLKIAKRKWLWFRFPKKNLSIITVSKYAEKEIKKYLPLKNVPFQPIYHGFDQSIFYPDQSISRNSLLHISAYQKKKNVENIIRAFSCIPKEKRVPLILIVPNFPPCQPIEGIKIIREKQTPESVATYMRSAIAFVFPSFHESFGMPLIEAMACGCPIITSNLTACPEIVENAAILVNPKEINQIKNAMMELVENDTLCNNLSNNAIQRASHFGWEKTAIEHLSFFKKMSHLA